MPSKRSGKNISGMTLVNKVLSHHSTNVGDKGDAFAGLLLGAAAAAPDGVPPDDALDWQHVQALQAVPAGRGEAASFGQAPLPAGEHSGGGHDAQRGDLPHLLIQLLNLSLLGGLQGLYLPQVSDGGGARSPKVSPKIVHVV